MKENPFAVAARYAQDHGEAIPQEIKPLLMRAAEIANLSTEIMGGAGAVYAQIFGGKNPCEDNRPTSPADGLEGLLEQAEHDLRVTLETMRTTSARIVGR